MRSLTVLIIFILTVSCSSGYCADPPPSDPAEPYNSLIVNGEIIANEISKATGCAISPILGISVLGAYTYYTTPVHERNQVPWHAKPAFWVPLLVVLLGIILKDSSKIAMPKIILMPLDAIETLLEKNVSAVLGLLVILSTITEKSIDQLQLAGFPLLNSFISSAYAAENVSSAAAATSSGILELGFLYVLVTVVFGLVWMVSQSFNFLIFLCPFSWLDLLLTTIKNAIVSFLVGSYLLNPYLGLLVSCTIILISFFLFAKSYRFVIFGTLFSSDVLLKKSRKHAIESDRIKAFAGSVFEGIPPLSYGSLTVNDSNLTFQFKPWLFMPSRSVTTTYRAENCEAGIGTLSPVIITQGTHFDTDLTLFRLRPLYLSHEKRVAELLGLKDVRDVTIGKTLKDSYRWLVDQLGITPAKTAVTPGHHSTQE